jgi:CheY-like chemotaxis protein
MRYDPEVIDSYIGKKIRHFRVKKNWPLKILSDELGVSLQQVQKYEQGQSRISAALLYKLGRIFSMPPGQFFDGYNHESADHTDTSHPEKFNILVIDDSPEDDFILRKALDEVEKLSIFTVHDPDEALNLFRAYEGQAVTDLPKPDLIFLDIHLPHMSGLDLLKTIKAKPHLHNTPVIILTNSSNAKDMDEAYKHHASGFVRKSFSFDEFSNHVQQAVNYWMNVVDLPDTDRSAALQ